MNESLFYRCETCGNIVALIRSGGGTLTCCGQDMTKLVANSTDGVKEKHLPVISKEGAKIIASVGCNAHPMTTEHYIEWIAMVTDDKIEMVYLKPGKEPKAEFIYYPGEDKIPYTGLDDEIVPNCEGQSCNFVYSEKSTNKVIIYAYCNLHGLWKTEL
jgi:superoxide reductase